MLVQLRIEDFAIIDQAELAPGPGLNVLTGETGAGKSIIVGASSLLRGGRVSADMVRAGAGQAVIEALFDVTGHTAVAERLAALGLPDGGGELVVRRIVASTGRGRVYINGALCTVAMLAEVVGPMLDISGQHDHQALSDPAAHRELLDALYVAPADLARLRAAHGELKTAAEALGQVELSDQERAQRRDLITFQLRELEAAALVVGEDTTLSTEQRRLARAAELLELCASGEHGLYSDDGSVSDRLAHFAGRLHSLSNVEPALSGMARQLEEARLQVEDVAQELSRYPGSVELDAGRLAEVEERLALLSRLKRKYGATHSELVALTDRLRTELDGLERLDERRETLASALLQARAEAEALAGAVSRARSAGAVRLGKAVTEELGRLRMEGARFEVELGPLAIRDGDDPAFGFGARRLGAAGWDRVEFLVAANPGEALLPIRKVASGGELSRLMLAFRIQLGKTDPVLTSIYDEVDAGIGGATASVVGRALAEVGRHRQVLCVTHLPQVAAYGEQHFHVGKATTDGRTRTSILALGADERVEELSRMLGGTDVSDEARANARKLLESASVPPKKGARQSGALRQAVR